MSTANDLDPSAADGAVGNSSGIFGQRYPAGEALTQGQPLCLKDASGTTKAYKAQGAGTAPLANCVGLAFKDTASGDTVFIVRLGWCKTASARWIAAPSASDAGKLAYLSTTAGTLTATATTAGPIGVIAFDKDGNLGVEVQAIGSRYLPY